jgi:glycosyltransferase involved in cell wall biosynthesis
VVVHERTGLLVEKEDAAALAAAVERLLARPEWAAEMGRAARSRALEAFSLERLVDSYDALYHELTGGAADPFFSRGSQVGCP